MGRRKLTGKNVLQYANDHYITVDKGKKRSANKDVNRVLQEVTATMKRINPLFNKMFETFLYAGSFYDGLKVGKPNEFDIDLMLNLPKLLNVQIMKSDRSGFVHIHLKNWKKFENTELFDEYRQLENLKDDNNYLSQEKVKSWMESIVARAINEISETREFEPLNIKYKDSGPAVTLIIKDQIHVDLVGVIKIPDTKWPEYPVRPNPSRRMQSYLLVPKPPKITNLLGPVNNPERYWRLSFPQQEREIMYNLNNCKMTLRIMKKLRDTRTHNIPSYYIKTIFLWEIDKNKNNKSFWTKSPKELFIYMLGVYIAYLTNKKIPYYWDSNNDLISANSEVNIENIKDYLQGILEDIMEDIYNPIIIVKHILPENEYRDVCREFKVPYV